MVYLDLFIEWVFIWLFHFLLDVYTTYLYICLQSPPEPDDISFVYISATRFSRNLAGEPILRIENSLVMAVRSGSGGAIYFGDDYQDNSKDGKLQVELGASTVFTNNNAQKGGAIASIRVKLMSMESVSFEHNFGLSGGALYVEAGGDKSPLKSRTPAHYLDGRNISFVDNVGDLGGSLSLIVSPATANLERKGLSLSIYQTATYNLGGSPGNEDDVFLEDSNFVGNRAIDCGGAVYMERGRLGCKNCSFVKNQMIKFSTGNGGAVCMVSQSALHGRNAHFHRNVGHDGGAIFADTSLVDLVGANIISNVAKDKGGGLYVAIPYGTLFEHNVSTHVRNVMFLENKAQVGGMHVISV